MAARTAASVKRWAVAHFLATLLLIVWNYVANARVLFAATVGEISDRYSSAFTPAGYAFSIWGLIFLGLLALGVFGLRRAFGGRGSGAGLEAAPSPSTQADAALPDHFQTAFIQRLGAPFLLAQLVCGAWLAAWLLEAIWVSLALMVALWGLLLWVIVRLNMERFDAPWPVIAFVWWPLSLYSGWINVALFANVGAAVAAVSPRLAQTSALAIALAAVLVVTNLAMIFFRNMREFSAPAVWALVAVFARHRGSSDIPELGWAALAGAGLIGGAAVLHASRHFTWPPRRGPSAS